MVSKELLVDGDRLEFQGENVSWEALRHEYVSLVSGEETVKQAMIDLRDPRLDDECIPEDLTHVAESFGSFFDRSIKPYLEQQQAWAASAAVLAETSGTLTLEYKEFLRDSFLFILNSQEVIGGGAKALLVHNRAFYKVLPLFSHLLKDKEAKQRLTVLLRKESRIYERQKKAASYGGMFLQEKVVFHPLVRLSAQLMIEVAKVMLDAAPERQPVRSRECQKCEQLSPEMFARGKNFLALVYKYSLEIGGYNEAVTALSARVLTSIERQEQELRQAARRETSNHNETILDPADLTRRATFIRGVGEKYGPSHSVTQTEIERFGWEGLRHQLVAGGQSGTVTITKVEAKNLLGLLKLIESLHVQSGDMEATATRFGDQLAEETQAVDEIRSLLLKSKRLPKKLHQELSAAREQLHLPETFGWLRQNWHRIEPVLLAAAPDEHILLRRLIVLV